MQAAPQLASPRVDLRHRAKVFGLTLRPVWYRPNGQRQNVRAGRDKLSQVNENQDRGNAPARGRECVNTLLNP